MSRELSVHVHPTGRGSAVPRLLTFVFLIGVGCSHDPPPKTGHSAATHPADAGALKAPGEATVGDRTLCMISNEEFVVTASSPKVEHEGETYYFCCKGCDDDFKKDPEKYLHKKP